MQGKILSPQLISGDDGKRYEYYKNDVINLDGKDLAVLTGSQVEFLSFDKRVAKSIYIIAENLNVSSILSADSIRSARLKALWGIGLLIFSFILFFNFIPYIGKIIAIVSFVLYSMAIYSVSKAAASKSLFKNYIKAVIISFFCFFIYFMLAPSGAPSTSGFIAMGLLGAMIILIAAIYLYEIHYELARLSGISLFLWSFWIFVVSVPFCFLLIMSLGFFVFFLPGFVGLIMSWMLLFLAWWRFGKVEKR
ncbi:MAG: hypothetical protein MR658_01770 [Campylobacter sp.]|uniref:hypothetical protein n=1 Tax=Campylobacter sp. TaxID=205 RepID=UPI002A7604E8|nr:hypothetical protein [Campylobacter sp.]MCI6177555.1 hypothetical protein [Campylobacter sp.]MDY3246186.1 hypothetical protein [Campylobacter sp.]